MLRLNSKKDPKIKDYVPESPVNPDVEATQGQRTWYRDAIKALIHDKQILSSINNVLLSNMSDDDATAIRAKHRDLLTARQIMQYLEDAYGIMGPSHLEYITTNLLRWDPTQPARLNFIRLEEFWEVLQYNDTNMFMNLQHILNAHPSVLAVYTNISAITHYQRTTTNSESI